MIYTQPILYYLVKYILFPKSAMYFFPYENRNWTYNNSFVGLLHKHTFLFQLPMRLFFLTLYAILCTNYNI